MLFRSCLLQLVEFLIFFGSYLEITIFLIFVSLRFEINFADWVSVKILNTLHIDKLDFKLGTIEVFRWGLLPSFFKKMRKISTVKLCIFDFSWLNEFEFSYINFLYTCCFPGDQT